MKIDLTLECPVERSFRVEQIAGIFDCALEDKLREQFAVELPDAGEEWRIGAIVGPSGSGKSSIARRAFGDDLYTGFNWPAGPAIDGFADGPDIKHITHTLAAVGFSSPPSWVKPYAVLSNGEKFRCDLARALLLDRPLVAYDEFTSVVDRNVAKIGSAAVAKALRKGRLTKRFVAVTCHYDVLDWLEPDWVLDMASRQLARGCLPSGERRWRRPAIRLDVAPVDRSAWLLFRRHHYLSSQLMGQSRAFCAFWGDLPVAFTAWTHRMARGRRRGDMREHRTVVLPDFQGLGFGNRLSEFVASVYCGSGGRAFSTTSHPAMIAYRNASPLWRLTRHGMTRPTGTSGRMMVNSARGRYQGNSCLRVTAGHEYVGPPAGRAFAAYFLACRPRRFQVD